MPGLFSLTISEARGQVATNADIDRLAVVIGPTSAGSGLSSWFLSGASAQAAVGYGDGSDCLAQIIEQRQQGGGAGKKYPAAIYTPTASQTGAYGTPDVSGKAGSSAVSCDASSPPNGTYEAWVRVQSGGTLGSPGITYQTSLDGGRNWSRTMSLGTAATTGKGSLTSSAASFPVALVDGETFVGKVDEQGSADTLTIDANPAVMTGIGTPAFAGVAGTIVFKVKGIGAGNGIPQTVTFAGTENSEAKAIAVFVAQLRGTTAADDSGNVAIASDISGTGSRIEIVSGTALLLTDIGMSVGVVTGTGNVADVDAVTATEFAGLLTSTFTGGTAGSVGIANSNDSVTWQTNTGGASPKGVQFTSGSGVAKISGFNTSEHNGTANAYALTIANSGVKFLFGAGGLTTGDVVKVRTLAPVPDASGIDAAFAALAASSADMALIVCDFPCTAALAAHVSTGLDTLAAVGKLCTAIIRTRIRNFEGSESESTWMASVESDFATFVDDRIVKVAAYGFVTDAMTSNQYLRSDLAAKAAATVGVDVEIMPCTPNQGGEANVSLVDAAGDTIGHDDGPRGAATGLSNDTLGNTFWTCQRMPVPAVREVVYGTVPWTSYPADGRIRNLPTRRIVNSMKRTAIAAGISALGGKLGYIPAKGANPAMLTEPARAALQSYVFQALSTAFRGKIENWADASLDTGLVQIDQVVTVTGGNLLSVTGTLAPIIGGYLLSESFTLAVQE